jgi:hypothetical protein
MMFRHRPQIAYAIGGLIAVSLLSPNAGARPHFSDCAVKMEIPAPLIPGTVRTPEFEVKRKLYFILLHVEPGNLSIWDVSCLLGHDYSSLGVKCDKESMVEAHWIVWDGRRKVAQGSTSGSHGRGETPDERNLGQFEGESRKKYSVELTFTKDGGVLKDLHPYLVVRQDYDFWCTPM